ncbi:MAG: hypothetical protein SFU86_19150 [Pirellulaceae bacterium]|nr:hypothetical protein [Pirellulaceae bacterium]
MSPLSDTPVEFAEIQAAAFRALPEHRKLELLDAMVRSGRELADIGYRMRKPDATPRECLENWVRLTVPAELVTKALEGVVESAESAIPEVRHLARKLFLLNIELVVGGSVACSMYTQARHTQDADVSVLPFPGREEEVVTLLQDEYYVSLPAVRSAVEKRRTFNVMRNATTFKIDLFIQGNRPFDRSAMARRRTLQPEFPGDAPVFVHSPEDVILHKLARFRLGNEGATQQMADIAGVLRNQRGLLDEDYLRQWAKELNVLDLWERAKAEDVASAAKVGRKSDE